MLIMASNSKIEWTHHTGNLWWGCSKVHAGCDNCYAEGQANRYGHKVWGNDAPRMATKSVWGDFLKWQAAAHAAGEIHRVFVGSMMDIFEKPMPLVDWQGRVIVVSGVSKMIDSSVVDTKIAMPVHTSFLRQKFFTHIVPNCLNLDFLLLTKRPSNINKYIPEEWLENPPENVMFGASVSDQKTFDDMVYHLKKVKGRKFLSVEPQLDWIRPTMYQMLGIDWVIQGGESGPHKRPFDIEWARWMRDFCAELGVPYFFKQIDKIQPIPEDLMVRQFSERK